ncbi:MAG: hypothetical protein H7Z42_12325 [Roseiflexaceae bacterium]|nr:hypothetical protein [Roseiflexaceae bacterium]
MAANPRRKRLYLLVIDPYKLLPPELCAAISAGSCWTVVDEGSRHAPTQALLVAGELEKPAAMVRRVFTTIPIIPAIVFDAVPSMSRQSNLFNAGANGYAVPGVTLVQLAAMFELARLGGFSACPNAVALMRAQSTAMDQFSRREHQIVTRVVLGASPETVAEELRLPLTTVNDTLGRVCRKAGVESLPALATWWVRWTLLDEAAESDDELDEYTAYAMTA